jgi:hypothetical protein
MTVLFFFDYFFQTSAIYLCDYYIRAAICFGFDYGFCCWN